MVEVDKGYLGKPKCKVPLQGITTHERKEKSVARGQHETINGRLRNFNVLASCFHHHHEGIDETMAKHEACFAAVAVITQLKILCGETEVFDVKYNVSYNLPK